MFDYNKVDWSKNGGKAKLDFFSCAFNVEDNYNIVTFHIVAFNCNGTDLNCTADDIFNGPFTIKFNRPLHLSGIRDVTYDEEDIMLIIDGEQYKPIYSDICYFCGDFQAEEKQALGNLMKRLAEYIKLNYV